MKNLIPLFALLQIFISTNIMADDLSGHEFLDRNRDILVSCCECLCATSRVGGYQQEVGSYPNTGSIRRDRKQCESNEGKECTLPNGRKSKLIYCNRDINLKTYQCKNVLKTD
jgi:hypothetical protein